MASSVERGSRQAKGRLVAVVTGDVIGSSNYAPRERRQLDRELRAAFRQVARAHSTAIYAPLAFRVTAGDEFQCVLSEPTRAFEIVMLLRAIAASSRLRPVVRFRAAIGVGTMSVSRRADPYAADGPAFVMARSGLEAAKRSRTPLRWTTLTTQKPDLDASADVVLALLDGLMSGWTPLQWQAVRWTLAGLDRKATARKLGIAHQNVSKRLHAADWPRFKLGADFVGTLLEETLHPSMGAKQRRTLQRVRE